MLYLPGNNILALHYLVACLLQVGVIPTVSADMRIHSRLDRHISVSLADEYAVYSFDALVKCAANECTLNSINLYFLHILRDIR